MNAFYPRHEGHAEEAAATAAADASTSHDDHASSSASSSEHGGMHMFFQTDNATPLYSAAWTPSNAGTYAATCIFLVVLAMAARGLVALRSIQEARWLDQDARRRYIAANGKAPLSERVSQDRDAKSMTLSENGVEESVFVVERKRGITRPWRFSVDPVRAVLDTVIVGIGYLLMLAVMTFNVGYFLSVLGGVFIGSMAVGRYSVVSEH